MTIPKEIKDTLNYIYYDRLPVFLEVEGHIVLWSGKEFYKDGKVFDVSEDAIIALAKSYNVEGI